MRVSEAPSHGKPVIVYDINCAGSKAYLQLAKELVKREKTLGYGSAQSNKVSAAGRVEEKGVAA